MWQLFNRTSYSIQSISTKNPEIPNLVEKFQSDQKGFLRWFSNKSTLIKQSSPPEAMHQLAEDNSFRRVSANIPADSFCQ